MLYDDHRLFISTGSGPEAVAFRKQEATLLSQGNFMEAFDLTAKHVQAEYGSKYNNAIQEARVYYQNTIVPQLKQQLQPTNTNR